MIPTARAFPIPYFTFKGSLVDSRLRASNEHIPIVRVPRAGGRPGYPAPFSASCCSSCAALGPMVGYGRCIWSGGKTCGRRTGRRICRSGSAGREWSRPALRHFACCVGNRASPGGGALRSAPGFRNSCHFFILRHFTGQLIDDVDGRTVGPPPASDAAESTAGERHYRLALGLGKQDDGQSHDGRTSGVAGYALRPSDEVREFGCQVVVPPAAYRPQTCLSATMVDAMWGATPLIQ